MRHKFASLKEPAEYGYTYDSEAWERLDSAFFGSQFRQFRNYGDGLIQHSGDWAIQVDHLADYLASLAVYLMQTNNEELLSTVQYKLGRRPNDEQIEFAASIVFKSTVDLNGADTGYEKKRRYYSVEESKVTTSADKRHDRRYHEVEPWCDGTSTAIYRMLIPESSDGMEKYCFAEAIREWAQERTERPYFSGIASQFLGWFDKDAHRGRELRYGFMACKSVCEAYRNRCEAETALSNLHWPIGIKESEVA